MPLHAGLPRPIERRPVLRRLHPWLEGARRHRGLAAVDLAHHDATRALEQQAEPHPHCGVIVGQKNADSFKCLRHAEIPSDSCVSAGSR